MKKRKLNQHVFNAMVEGRKYAEIRSCFDTYNLIDVAALAQNLETEQLLMLFKILRREVSSEMFTYLSAEKQEEVVNAFTSDEISRMLNNLMSDDIVEFLGELPANLVKKILIAASPEQRSEINHLLAYPEDSVGSIMSPEFVELKATDTVKRAITKIRSQGKITDVITNCYVIDANRRLVGSIRLREILFNDEDQLIGDLMETDVKYVHTTDDQEAATETFRKYDLSVLPVVNDEQRLIGIITADDIIDVLTEETTEDIHKMAAIIPIDDSYLNTSVWTMFKSRIAWLIVLMVSATFTGLILQGYEAELTLIPALASAMPMILSTAGNAGSQSSIMVIRGISVDGLRLGDVKRVLWKELQIALVIGAILFAVNYVRLLVFMPQIGQATTLVICLTVFITVVLAKLSGGILPLIALFFKQDPAAMASPLITTVVDALALYIYFNLAAVILQSVL